jgi:hypothetical protein
MRLLSVLRHSIVSRIIGAAMVVFLSGCSAIQTGYQLAPNLLYFWLDGYLDLDESQTPIVRASLQQLEDWHRREELPAYAKLVRDLQQLAPQNITPAQMCTVVSQVREGMQRIGAQVAPGFARLAPTLTETQFTHLQRQWDKHNATWREEWLEGTPDALLSRRMERMQGYLEDFYGRLSDAQMKLLRQRMSDSGYEPQQAWAERQRRQRDMLQVLRAQRSTPPGQRLSEMQALVRRTLTPPDPLPRAHMELGLQQTCITLAALHNSASPAQRKQLAERLRKYETDFMTLAEGR